VSVPQSRYEAENSEYGGLDPDLFGGRDSIDLEPEMLEPDILDPNPNQPARGQRPLARQVSCTGMHHPLVVSALSSAPAPPLTGQKRSNRAAACAISSSESSESDGAEITGFKIVPLKKRKGPVRQELQENHASDRVAVKPELQESAIEVCHSDNGAAPQQQESSASHGAAVRQELQASAVEVLRSGNGAAPQQQESGASHGAAVKQELQASVVEVLHSSNGAAPQQQESSASHGAAVKQELHASTLAAPQSSNRAAPQQQEKSASDRAAVKQELQIKSETRQAAGPGPGRPKKLLCA
jgi:hypothetical protein